MLTCNSNENCKNITSLISELSFPPYRRGWGIQQSVILGDSALIVQPITLLYTIFDCRGAPWGAESSQRRSHTNVYQSRVAQKYKFNDFFALLENVESLNYYPILRRNVELYLFVLNHREWESFFFLSLLANAVNSGYDQYAERCLSAVFLALLTCWHVQFSKIFVFLFPP